MKTKILAIVAAFTMILATSVSAVAPTVVTSDRTPQAGQVITFSLNDVPTNAQRIIWSWTFNTGGCCGRTLNGGQMGEGSTVNYAFSAFAASKPYVTVKAVIGLPGTTHPYVVAYDSYVVSP